MKPDAYLFVAAANDADAAIADGDWLGALRHLARSARLFSDLAADVAVEAVREGHTVKETAASLGVSPHTLRGIRQEAGVA